MQCLKGCQYEYYCNKLTVFESHHVYLLPWTFIILKPLTITYSYTLCNQFLPRARTNYRKFNIVFWFQGPRVWNSVNESVNESVKSSGLTPFKNKHNKGILTNLFCTLSVLFFSVFLLVHIHFAKRMFLLFSLSPWLT